MLHVFYVLLMKVVSTPELAALAVAAGATLCFTAVGLAWSRQWYLLPVAAILLGLVGFLVNPIADASTPLDLRAKLTVPAVVTGACIFQLVLVGLATWCGLRLCAAAQPDRWQLMLGVLHCVPLPLLAVSLLLVEQTFLAEQLGARPETVGLGTGALAGAMLLMLAGACALLSRERQASLHAVLALVTSFGCCLLVSIGQDCCESARPSTAQPEAPLLLWLGITLFAAGALIALGAACASIAERRALSN